MLAYSGKDGELWMGGMITKIAMHFNVDLTVYSSLAADFIDRTYLLQAGVIEMAKGKLSSRFVTHAYETRVNIVPLSPQKMDLMHIPNWYAVWACDPSFCGAAIRFDATHLRRREQR